MSEETNNPTPEETLPAAAPAPEAPARGPDAEPTADGEEQNPAAGREDQGDPDSAEATSIPDGQPRWYVKGRKAIPGKLFPARIKSDGVKAWAISFYAVLIGLVIWMFSMAHGWACGPLSIAGIVGLYYALLAAKRTPDASRRIAISIGMLGLVSLVFVLGGCELGGIHRESDWDALREKQFSAEQAVDAFVESLSKPSENQ